jgi:hypothetical protein
VREIRISHDKGGMPGDLRRLTGNCVYVLHAAGPAARRLQIRPPF